MKILLSIEKDERQALTIQCCVQGFSELETKERWAGLMSSVDKLLGQEREESDTVPNRHGVFF